MSPKSSTSSKVVWVKAGSKLSPGRTEVEDRAVLRIRGVTANDAGEYRCAAENIAGAIEASAFLQIQSEKNESDADVDIVSLIFSATCLLGRARGQSDKSWREAYLGLQTGKVRSTCSSILAPGRPSCSPPTWH